MSIGVALPITRDDADGFTMYYSVRATMKQNFKMLILTNPGERVMEPGFGVGIKQFLFTNFAADYKAQISSKIQSQVARYMPSIAIRSIDYIDATQDNNRLAIQIKYSVPELNLQDLLDITI